MRPPCSALLVAAALFAIAGPSALAGTGSNEAIYTWVDAHGVRHYADQPGSPNAKRLSFTAAGAPHITPVAPAPTSAAGSRHHSTQAPATTMSPTERAALCTKLRAEVKRIEPARRLQVNENSTSRYLSGDDLQAFKVKMQLKMETVCAAQSQR